MIPTGSAHYKDGKVEPLELIESQDLCFHLANVIKYSVRANHYAKRHAKFHEEESIAKAKWYLDRHLEVKCGQTIPSSS